MLDKQKIARAAEELAQKGQFDKAIKEMQRLLQEDPSYDFAWLKIGDWSVKKGDTKQGASVYLEAAKLYTEQQPTKAIQILNVVLSLDPTRVECHQRLALLYHAQGKDREAVEQLEPYANYFEQNKKYDEAIQVRQRMLELVPDNLPVRVKLAEIYSQLNKRDEAVKEFSRVAKQLKQIGRQGDYTKVVERLLFHKPDDKEHLLALAKVYLEQNNPREALNKLQGLYIIDPKNLDVLELLAETFQLIGIKPKAIRVLKEIARQRPEMKPSLFARVLELDPEDPDARSVLQPDMPNLSAAPPAAQGLSPFSLTNIPSLPSQVAKLPNKSTPASDKDDREAKITKKIAEAELYVKYGLQEKAIDHLQNALEIAPDHPKLLRVLQELYVGVGDYHRAIPLMLAVARSAPADEAKTILQQVLQYDPRHEEARALYQGLGGSMEEEIDEADLIEEENEEDLLEEVAEVVEAQEAQLKATGPGRVRAGSTMISMSPFYEVAEVAEVGEVRPQKKSIDPYAALLGAPVEGAGFGFSETTSQTNRSELGRAQQQETNEVESGLSEIEYFLEHGLYDDARNLIDSLYRSYPNNAAVQQRYGDFYQAESDDATGAQPGIGSPFELGLAYRERGMIDEAIREFQSLIGSGQSDATCYHLIGVCYSDKGRFPEAIDAFKRALHVGGLAIEDEMGIYYALGATHEALGDYSEASYYYKRVQQRDPRFRDVGQRIQALANIKPAPAKRDRESGASPLPVRRDPGQPQAIARSRNDDDRYS